MLFLRFLLFLATSVRDFLWARPPTRKEVVEDLGYLESCKVLAEALDTDPVSMQGNAVRAYYESTTYRDYAILDLLGADGCMHTPLSREGPLRAPFLESVMLVLSRVPGGGSVLELGCGKGANALFLKSLLPSSRVVGVDLIPVHVQHARLRASDIGCGDITFVVADVGNIGVPGNMDCANINESGAGALETLSFDTIFAIESMCYLSEDGARRLME